MATHLDVDRVRDCFSYDRRTGVLSARKTYGRGGRFKAGTTVGCLHTCGTNASKKEYLRINFDGSHVYVHRVIWVLVTGEQPATIDHIDGNGMNNRWENIRSVSHSINGKNQKVHKTNTSGTSGITYRKDSGRWRSRIMVNGAMINLGSYENKEEAINARRQAEIKYWSDIS